MQPRPLHAATLRNCSRPANCNMQNGTVLHTASVSMSFLLICNVRRQKFVIQDRQRVVTHHRQDHTIGLITTTGSSPIIFRKVALILGVAPIYIGLPDR
jgi:hypothetical protein